MNASMQAVQIPGLSVSDVLVEHKRLILGQNTHSIDAGINAVGQRKIDDTVLSAEGNCGFCQLLGQGVQTRSLAAGKKHCYHFFGHNDIPLVHIKW